MDKFEKLLDEMTNDARPPRRTNAFERLLAEFPDKRKAVLDAAAAGPDVILRKRAMLEAARDGDRAAADRLGKELDAELASPSRDFMHWAWLTIYLNYYAEAGDARMVARFFPFASITDNDLGFAVIKAIRSLKLRDGVPALIKAAERSQPPQKIQEHALAALGDIAGPDAVESIQRIGRSAGAVSKRLAREAVEKIRARHGKR